MKKTLGLRARASIVILSIFLQTFYLQVEAQDCKISGYLIGTSPPGDQCNTENDSACCVQGEQYPQYQCSPFVTSNTNALLTLNSFEAGRDGGGPPACEGPYHSDNTPVVALSTGWFNGGSRCFHNIIITGNGRSVTAMVVDECDSIHGCDGEHSYQPPCPNNNVDASEAVWEALDVPKGSRGQMYITWTDA